MRYRISHETRYGYSEQASLSQNELFLRPRETANQRVLQSRLQVVPKPQYIQSRTDYFGNTAHLFMVQHPHTELTMTAESVVETTAPEIPLPADTPPWETVARDIAAAVDPKTLDAIQFIFQSPMVELGNHVRDYARASFPPERPVLAGAVDLMKRIHTEFGYDKSATTIDSTVAQVLEKRKGVCQDFSHLAIGCLRAMGLAARYVSGYLETQPPPGKSKLVGADASHAWLSLFVPGTGWVDIDPTNNLIPGDQHITLAWGRDYGDVTPVKGVVMGGGVHTLSVMVDVAAEQTGERSTFNAQRPTPS